MDEYEIILMKNDLHTLMGVILHKHPSDDW